MADGEYYLLRSDTHYVIAEAIVKVQRSALKTEVDAEIEEEFDPPAEMLTAVVLPPPAGGQDAPGDGAVQAMAGMRNIPSG